MTYHSNDICLETVKIFNQLNTTKYFTLGSIGFSPQTFQTFKIKVRMLTRQKMLTQSPTYWDFPKVLWMEIFPIPTTYLS